MQSEEELLARMRLLGEEHRDLDAAIAALSREINSDQVQLARLKKRKLRIRDEIEALRDLVRPDIIA